MHKAHASTPVGDQIYALLAKRNLSAQEIFQKILIPQGSVDQALVDGALGHLSERGWAIQGEGGVWSLSLDDERELARRQHCASPPRGSEARAMAARLSHRIELLASRSNTPLAGFPENLPRRVQDRAAYVLSHACGKLAEVREEISQSLSPMEGEAFFLRRTDSVMASAAKARAMLEVGRWSSSDAISKELENALVDALAHVASASKALQAKRTS